ncbi:MAG: alpha/beta hydrolase [Marmoricola sp.]
MTDTYRTLGSGSHTVLCLHGWFGSSTGWGEDFVSVLDGETFRYVFMNYRGYGERADVSGDYTVEEIAQDALDLADELGADRFSVVGHSMGGSAAQKVLALAPDRVQRLVGISPVPASGVPFDDQGWGLFSGAAQEDGNRAAIIDLTTGNRLSQRWIDSVVQHSVDRSTREAFGAYLESWAKADFSAEVSDNPVPALAVVGEHDPALGADTVNATWMKTYPNARLEVMANAGHYAMYETPVALATVMERFLSE